jgi:hypothetical protein
MGVGVSDVTAVAAAISLVIAALGKAAARVITGWRQR